MPTLTGPRAHKVTVMRVCLWYSDKEGLGQATVRNSRRRSLQVLDLKTQCTRLSRSELHGYVLKAL